MGFASGFQAGLSAVKTAKEMRDERMLREGLASLEEDYTQSNQPYDQAEETAGLTGAPLQSAVTAPMAQSPANAALGLGGPAPAMSPVMQQPPMAAQALGTKPEPISVSAPPAMTDRDYRMKQIGLYRKFGDPRMALEMERSMAAEDQANRQYDLAVKKFDALNDQFTKTFAEQVRSAKVSEGQAQEKIDILTANQNRLAEETTATINNMNTRLEAFSKDRATAEAVDSGKLLFKQGLRQGKNVDEILAEIEASYPGEENSNLRLAAVTAATSEYYTQNGINDVTAGQITKLATNPIEATLNIDFGGDIAKEATNWNEVIQGFADPDYSDGIETKLVQLKDPKTGKPTGAFELAYGDRTLEQFNSIEDVRNYAKQYQENFSKNPYLIGQYLENTKTKAAATIARAKSSGEREERFAEFLNSNPQYVGQPEKIMGLRQLLGMDSPLGGWGSGSDEYINPGDATATKDDQTFSSVTAGLVKRREENRAKLAPSMFRGPTAEETAKGQDLLAEVITAIESGSLSPAEAELAINSVDASPQARRMALDEIARYRTGLK